MKKLFVYTFCLLILMSAAAWKMVPHPKDDKVVLTWVSDDNPARREQIAALNKQFPKYSLQLDPANSTMEKVIVQSIAGMGPDMFDCYDAGGLSAYVKSNIAWDITDELKKRNIDVQKICWSVVLPEATYKGRVYGFPSNVGNRGMWFNKDIFDRCHISYPKGPWKWDEFISIAKRLTIRDKYGRVKQYGFMGDWSMWPDLVLQWGGHIYSKDGKRCLLDSPQAIAGVQFLHDLVYKYKVMPSPIEQQSMSTQGGWGSGWITLFADGRGAMAFGGRYWLCQMRTMEKLPRLGVVECPYERVRATVGLGRVLVINKNSPRREQALDMLIQLAGRDYNDLVNHQADGLGGVKKFAYTNTYLHDREFPKEDYNAVWRDSIEYAVPAEISPYISADVASRIINKQIDLVKNDQKSASDAMKAAARDVNEQIRKSSIHTEE